MLELSEITLIEAIIFSSLVYFYNRSIKNEGSIIALSLQSFPIHIRSTLEGSVDQSGSSFHWRRFLLLFLLTIKVKLVLRVIEVPEVALFVGLPVMSVLLRRLLLRSAGLLNARH